jgi:hypothetical protein
LDRSSCTISSGSSNVICMATPFTSLSQGRGLPDPSGKHRLGDVRQNHDGDPRIWSRSRRLHFLDRKAKPGRQSFKWLPPHCRSRSSSSQSSGTGGQAAIRSGAVVVVVGGSVGTSAEIPRPAGRAVAAALEVLSAYRHLQVLGVVAAGSVTRIDLLVPQRRHRIDSHRSPGRQSQVA